MPPRLHAAPISTMTFVPKASTPSTPTNIPSTKHWSDMPAPHSIVVLQQPAGQICAVLGDIMASRLLVRGVAGVVAEGRVRDVHPIAGMMAAAAASATAGQGTGFTVWSRGTSTVGTGMEAKPWLADVAVVVAGLEVRAGDVMCADERERGCVVVPHELVGEVMGMLPGMKDVDDRCVADVQAGVDVGEAFRRHR